MTRRAATALIVFALLLGGCGGGSDGAARATATPAAEGRQLPEALDAELERTAEQAGQQGVASALVVRGRLVWAGATGMADIEAERPMTPRTPVYFASVSKTVTAAVALRLAERGRLELDAPVRRWIPEWDVPRAVTVRQLLGMNAGVRDPDEQFYIRQARRPGRPITPHDWLRALSPRESGPAYANASFILAGLAMKRAAGRDWDAVRHEVAPRLVLQPDDRVRGRPARFYWYPRGLGDPQPHGDGAGWVPSTAMATGAWTAGAWAGHTEALSRWGDRLFRGGVLAPASLAEMTDFATELDGPWPEYGLGLGRRMEDDEEVWGHSGGAIGVQSELWHVPRLGLTLATVANDELSAQPHQQQALLRVALESLDSGAGPP
ncbi:MAG TPA: serine hydrolase domain-containing protein [Solirubrobacteraceae bacterium]|nr:serine hydrolase domain-containing protein [Solirubrobacteraceae bacterium]